MPPRVAFVYAGAATNRATGNTKLAAGLVFAYHVKDAPWRALSRLREVRLPEKDGWRDYYVTVEELPLPVVRKLINDVPVEFIAQALQSALGRPKDEDMTQTAVDFKRALADIMLAENRVTRPLDFWDRTDMRYIAERRPAEEAILNEAGRDWDTAAI